MERGQSNKTAHSTFAIDALTKSFFDDFCVGSPHTCFDGTQQISLTAKVLGVQAGCKHEACTFFPSNGSILIPGIFNTSDCLGRIASAAGLDPTGFTATCVDPSPSNSSAHTHTHTSHTRLAVHCHCRSLLGSVRFSHHTTCTHMPQVRQQDRLGRHFRRGRRHHLQQGQLQADGLRSHVPSRGPCPADALNCVHPTPS